MAGALTIIFGALGIMAMAANRPFLSLALLVSCAVTAAVGTFLARP